MKSLSLPKAPAQVQTTTFLRPQFSMGVSSSQMSVVVTAMPQALAVRPTAP